jgi:predicted amidohydrolase/GNAT superfamily N-acetyltransferase
MEPREYEIHGEKYAARTPRAEDFPAMIRLHQTCFPDESDSDGTWRVDQFRSHLHVFEDGQIIVTKGAEIVGVASSLIVNMSGDPLRHHTYYGITDDGYFYNHDPQGDTLYGAEVYVAPEERGRGIGALLYGLRRELCKRLNLRRILAGGRLWNYEFYASQYTPEEYVHAVQDGKVKDPVMGFQLREGFVVRDVMPNYIRDPRSRNYATLIEWLNPDYVGTDSKARKVRVACVQYQMRKIDGFDEFAAQVRYFVETAGEDYGTDYILFPEFFSVQLLSAMEPFSSRDGIRRLAEIAPQFRELMSTLAREQGLHIIAGSHPVLQEDGRLQNEAMLFRPDGSYVSQPKLHITPGETTWWGITGGNKLLVVQTPKAKVGILICYDVEFPEAARYLAEHGVELLFVPYCTDNRQGYLRVTKCAAARAIENQIYVVCAGVVGNLPDVPAMDIHYGRAAVFTPSDFEFARDGIQAEADPNVETMLVTDLDIADLYRSREAGSVTPLMDRRRDLFELKVNLHGD